MKRISIYGRIKELGFWKPSTPASVLLLYFCAGTVVVISDLISHGLAMGDLAFDPFAVSRGFAITGGVASLAIGMTATYVSFYRVENVDSVLQRLFPIALIALASANVFIWYVEESHSLLWIYGRKAVAAFLLLSLLFFYIRFMRSNTQRLTQ